MQSCGLFFTNGVQLAFTWKGRNKDLKIWPSVVKMAKQTGNIAKMEEGRRAGGLAHCLSPACLIELMILMILWVVLSHATYRKRIVWKNNLINYFQYNYGLFQ